LPPPALRETAYVLGLGVGCGSVLAVIAKLEKFECFENDTSLLEDKMKAIELNFGA